MFRKSMHFVVTSLVVLLIVSTACAGPTPTEEAATEVPTAPPTAAPTTAPTEPPAEQKIIKIGAALPLTGSLFDHGEGIRRGYELWAEEVNRRGGIEVAGETYMVEMIFYDDQSDPTTGAQLAERLITQDEVDFIFGPFGSTLTRAVAGVTERYNYVFIQPSGNADVIYEEGYQRLFGLIPPASTVLKSVVDMWAALDPEATKVAVLYKDDIFATWVAQGAGERAEELGREIVFNEVYPVDAQDFSTLLTQMQAAEPDLLILGSHVSDLSLIVQQMRDLGVNVKAIGHAQALELCRDALGEDADYIFATQFWSPDFGYEGGFFGSAQDFNEAYRAKYGEDAYSVPAQAAAAGEIFLAAVAEADSLDQDAMEAALRDLDIVTFFGPVRYNELGINVAAQSGILQLQDGEVKLVWPAEIAPEGNEPLYPMPPWDER